VKVEIVISPDMVDTAIDTLLQAAATGKIGDGKIWVTEVETIVRIRTGERGVDAL
jgi:nitrogen regulatory protein P-II 1